MWNAVRDCSEIITGWWRWMISLVFTGQIWVPSPLVPPLIKLETFNMLIVHNMHNLKCYFASLLIKTFKYIQSILFIFHFLSNIDFPSGFGKIFISTSRFWPLSYNHPPPQVMILEQALMMPDQCNVTWCFDC